MRTAVKGKRVIITAGAGGIGQAVIRQLISAGAEIATCDISEEGVDRLRKEFPRIFAEVVDVGDARMQTRFLETAIERLVGIDSLVNNAGISGPTAHIECPSGAMSFVCTSRVTLSRARS
ncbi:SDR family NAD(P)-dependent oxidoreductase [Bradyrhizobium sp. CIR3A]|uniref:SDR family NAD(P)-dependent oxidoreductase n=1 Tax=Bradyrhizobium sp. CIR3A TaxID=2663838 RepID=UPI0018142B84|nr:NAD(P)-dependent dehydrogenase (short-subunit alcohol dehydrogenase family) [Bradyrhizobium sp. CIR3A]